MSKDIEVKVGEKVCVVFDGTNAMRGREIPKHYEGTITKVGRKYFHVDYSLGLDYRREVSRRFHIDNLRQFTDYSPEMTLHKSWEEYEKVLKTKHLYENIRQQHFSTYSPSKGLTLEDLIEVKGILEEARERS